MRMLKKAGLTSAPPARAETRSFPGCVLSRTSPCEVLLEYVAVAVLLPALLG